MQSFFGPLKCLFNIAAWDTITQNTLTDAALKHNCYLTTSRLDIVAGSIRNIFGLVANCRQDSRPV